MIDLLIQFSRFKGIIVQWLRAPGINIGTTSAAVSGPPLAGGYCVLVEISLPR